MKNLLRIEAFIVAASAFNEQEWKDSFEGIEFFVKEKTAAEFLNRRYRNSLYNPTMQFDDAGVAPDEFVLARPIWGDTDDDFSSPHLE